MNDGLADETTRQAYSDFIGSRSWDVFFTATFAARVNHAHTAVEMVAHKLYEHGLQRAVVMAESHRLGGYHCHGLFKNPSLETLDTTAGSIQDDLRKLGFCRVEPVRNTGAVSVYLTKYLTKHCADYEFYGDRRDWALDK